jgi:ABC-type lipoprotein export system ATPase subunit
MPDFVANAVTKEFDTPAGPLRILDGVSTKLDRGQNMAVIGDSGSGKSTFLHILNSTKINLLISEMRTLALSFKSTTYFRN